MKFRDRLIFSTPSIMLLEKGKKVGDIPPKARKAITAKVERIHAALRGKKVQEFANLMSQKAKAVSIMRGITLKKAKQQLQNHVSTLMRRENWGVNPLPEEMHFERINRRVVHVQSQEGNPVISGKPAEAPDKNAQGGYLEMDLFFAKIDGKWSAVW